jgi:hypothetical protein
MLAQPPQTLKELWLRVKSLVRSIESDDGVLVIDDSKTINALCIHPAGELENLHQDESFCAEE